MSSILTVTVAAGSYDLTTTDAVKDQLGITTSEDDDLFDAMVTRASTACTTALNRVLARETLSEQFRQDECRQALQLARWPVVSITSVIEDGVTLTADDYEIDKTTGQLWRLCNDERDWWKPAKITVVYVAGYILPDDNERDLPEDIEAACIELVKEMYLSRKRDPALRSLAVDGVATKQFWIGQVGENGALPPKVLALLAPYRNPVMG